MAGIAANTMIEDNSIECEDSKILNVIQNLNVPTGVGMKQEVSTVVKVTNGHVLSTEMTEIGNVKIPLVEESNKLSSQTAQDVDNIDTTVQMQGKFSNVSDNGDLSSLKFFDEICSPEKHERFSFITHVILH